MMRYRRGSAHDSGKRPSGTLPRPSHAGTLASRCGTWQWHNMSNTPPRKTPLAGGVLIAFGAVGGALWGLRNGQPTIGLLAGVGIAALLSVLLWLISRD